MLSVHCKRFAPPNFCLRGVDRIGNYFSRNCPYYCLGIVTLHDPITSSHQPGTLVS